MFEYVDKKPLMDKVLDAAMVKYGCSTRTEVYPYVVGMATECLSVESFESMLKALK
jgi:hypothetical protein